MEAFMAAIKDFFNFLSAVMAKPASASTKKEAKADIVFENKLGRSFFKKGDKNADVRILQEYLNKYVSPKIKVDGDFGKLTDKSVRAFQAANNLKVDGLAGPMTLQALGLIVADEKEPSRPDTAPVMTDEPRPTTHVEGDTVFAKNVTWQSKGRFITPSGMPKGLIVHYTVSGRNKSSALGVVNYFAGTPKSLGYQVACPVMDEDGNIYMPEGWEMFRDRNNHAGPSSWRGKSNLSSTHMGIEICNWGLLDSKTASYVGADDRRYIEKKVDHRDKGTYQKFTAKQESALIALCMKMKRECPDFSFDEVAGHDEVAEARKSDPGGSLSMSMLDFRKKIKGL